MRAADVAALVLVNPVSLRHACNYATCLPFQSRIPSTCLFMARDRPMDIFGAYADGLYVDRSRPPRGISFFDGGDQIAEGARLLADDLVNYLSEIGTDNRRVAIEVINPSVTQACLRRGLEVVDGMALAGTARVIRNEDELECIRWAIAVAEPGIAKVKEALRPGVTETRLWGLLNHTNLANHGEWHDGRMLASGGRINPWLQEASQRVIQSGDLVGLDTDMVGPKGCFCDISRTFLCGPAKPTKRQK
jgi:Xaa-Pro aminopeptidase